MDGPPEVPGSDIEEYGIKILTLDSSPFAEFPEKAKDALTR